MKASGKTLWSSEDSSTYDDEVRPLYLKSTTRLYAPKLLSRALVV